MSRNLTLEKISQCVEEDGLEVGVVAQGKGTKEEVCRVDAGLVAKCTKTARHGRHLKSDLQRSRCQYGGFGATDYKASC